MKTPAKTTPPAPALNMTPMIDVVFLLIIFFIVSSSLIHQENAMEIELPTARTGKMPEENQLRKLTINIPAEGKILIGTQPIDNAALRGYLEKQANDPTATEGIEVRIRVHRDIPYRNVAPILRDCAECGIWNVTFPVLDE